MNLRRIRFALLFLTAVLFHVCLLNHIEEKILQINCFSYETAYKNLRNHQISEEAFNGFISAADGDVGKFSELLTMYFAADGVVSDVAVLEKDIAFVKKYRGAEFSRIRGYVYALWNDLERFPVGEISGKSSFGTEEEAGRLEPIEEKRQAAFTFADSWMQSRTFGGERGHEGCDIMPPVNQRGIYPIHSMTDGVIENVGWLRLGGYRIGIRSDSGAYFYYAHLSEYAREFAVGERVGAGEHLGYMGDTGYSEIPGTTGKFDVHLHLGIYLNDADGNEFSVNSYPALRYLCKKKVIDTISR